MQHRSQGRPSKNSAVPENLFSARRRSSNASTRSGAQPEGTHLTERNHVGEPTMCHIPTTGHANSTEQAPRDEAPRVYVIESHLALPHTPRSERQPPTANLFPNSETGQTDWQLTRASPLRPQPNKRKTAPARTANSQTASGKAGGPTRRPAQTPINAETNRSVPL